MMLMSTRQKGCMSHSRPPIIKNRVNRKEIRQVIKSNTKEKMVGTTMTKSR